MKPLLLSIALFLTCNLFAQENIKTVALPPYQTVHFVSPEPIQYVDISGKELIGDLPLKNVLRIKVRDSVASFRNAVVTIAGEKYIAQYRIVPGTDSSPVKINILPADMHPLDIAGIGLSQNQLKALSLKIVAASPDKRMEKVKAFGITGQLNHIYTLDDYIFLDVSYRNKTNIKYDIADFRFKVDDKKITKASNVQSVELKPEFILFATPSFSRNYRNVFVFKKVTFPGNKELLIELSEKQISGRVITIKVSYKDLLEADIIPN